MPFELVLGGTRSGKSLWAEKRLLGQCAGLSRKPFYLATSSELDPGRLKAHLARRGDAFKTLEIENPDQIADTVSNLDGPVLIDSIGNLVTRVIGYEHERILELVDQLINALCARDAHAVVVSEEVGLSVHAATSLGRDFTDIMGRANQNLAEQAKAVHLIVAGIPLVLKS
jgi:adenosylcobinamide kinase/adenosylcobinamide-phosphate guanylyltransferase